VRLQWILEKFQLYPQRRFCTCDNPQDVVQCNLVRHSSEVAEPAEVYRFLMFLKGDYDENVTQESSNRIRDFANNLVGVFPPAEGTMLNAVMRVIAVPLALLLIVGGGIAAAVALFDYPINERRRTALAIIAPLGIPWVFAIFPFMAGKSAEAIFFGIIIGGALLMPILRKIRQHRVLTH